MYNSPSRGSANPSSRACCWRERVDQLDENLDALDNLDFTDEELSESTSSPLRRRRPLASTGHPNSIFFNSTKWSRTTEALPSVEVRATARGGLSFRAS